jgi:integrase
LLAHFLQKTADEKLSSSTIRKILTTVPLIIKSAEDDDCNPLYPKTWNFKSILEMVPHGDAQQPTISAKQLKNALKFKGAHTDRYRIVVALLAATGIRVGEFLALRASDDGEHSGWNQENSALEIRTSIWDGEEQLPKTKSAIRTVDLSEPVNAMVAAYVKNANKKPGDYLFATRNGKPYRPASLEELALAPLGVPGFHALRRWRFTHLRTSALRIRWRNIGLAIRAVVASASAMTNPQTTRSGDARRRMLSASGLIYQLHRSQARSKNCLPRVMQVP